MITQTYENPISMVNGIPRIVTIEEWVNNNFNFEDIKKFQQLETQEKEFWNNAKNSGHCKIIECYDINGKFVHPNHYENIFELLEKNPPPHIIHMTYPYHRTIELQDFQGKGNIEVWPNGTIKFENLTLHLNVEAVINENKLVSIGIDKPDLRAWKVEFYGPEPEINLDYKKFVDQFKSDSALIWGFWDSK